MKTGTLNHRRPGAAAVAFAALAAALMALAALAIGPAYAAPMTFTVDSTADTNLTACVDATPDDCTLRGAINAANANPDADTIEFEVPGAGVKTITPATNLPAIADSVTIDGYSQTGASANTKTLAQGNDAVLLIELTSPTGTTPLTINADGTTVRGLVINGNNTDKISLNASNVVIAGNFIGVDPTGGAAKSGTSGGFGIRQGGATPSPDSDNNTIGGTAPADRNVISGMSQGGIIIASGDATVIRGNYIGPNAAGTAALAQSGVGVNPLGGAFFAVTNTTISGNLISGNDDGSIVMSSGGRIQGNLIGTQRDGTSPLGNGNSGGPFLQGIDNVAVGGTAAGEGNTIAFNTGVGVAVQNFGNNNSKGILGNSIHSNGLLGIGLTGAASSTPLANDTGDGDGGANRSQNYPVITASSVSGGNATVSGTLNSTASTEFRVEFFANTACDASGNGEGRTFIGSTAVTTDGTGNKSFGPLTFNNVPAGQSVITSTATNTGANDTSEFSKCFTATGTPNSPPVAVNDPTTPGDPNYATNEDTSLTVPTPGVLANDTDADGDPLTVAPPRPASGPSNGTLTLNANGSFTYTPNANFNGTDSFTYKANDGAADSATAATVTITVNPVNDAPSFTKGPDQTVAEDSGPQTVPSWATNISPGPSNESTQTVNFVVANDNNALFTATGQPAISSNGTLTYTPASGANGSATVTVKLRDDGGTANGGDDESDPQTFTITVTPVEEPPENAAPVARNDTATTDEGDPVTIDVLANDTDDGGLDPGSVKIAAGPSNGAATINSANGKITYKPNNGFTGTDSFTYEVCDDAEPPLCDTATVTVRVAAAPPVADLSVRIQAPGRVRLGQNYRYTVTTTNRGPDTARNVTSRTVVPRSVRIVNISGACGANYSTRVVNCKLGNMPDDAVRRFRITVKPVRAGTVRLTSVSVSSATPDPNASNNRIAQPSSGQSRIQSSQEAPQTTVARRDSDR